MLTKDKIVVLMNAVADQVEAFCSEHERQDHNGGMCHQNRMSAVAFLAHRLGFDPKKQVSKGWSKGAILEVTADLFAGFLEEYAENCPGCNAGQH